MKFLKQNFLALIILAVLLVNVYKVSDLQAKYEQIYSQYFMLQSNINSIQNRSNSTQQQQPVKQVKDVMTPLDLAEYMGIELDDVYNIAAKDSTMPYVQVNGEYKFNKAAIDKWMEKRISIETK